MITLFGAPRSRSLRVSWVLEELELDWAYHHVDFSSGDHRRDEFLSINPFGKVPALADDDIIITESAAIMLYLAEKYGNQKLLPQPASEASSIHHRWVCFIISELEQPLWTISKHKMALPEELRQQSILPIAKWEFDRAAAIAEKWLPESEFLLGDTLSVADILLAHTISWARSYQQDIPPKLEAFRKRLMSRPAMRIALDKEIAASEKN